MRLEYWIKKFIKAVLENDYNEQSRIAEKLIPFEQSGMITEQKIIDIINGDCVAV